MPVEKPDIALSRWAELEDGTPAANVQAPPDVIRDTGSIAGTAARSRYHNELLRQSYRWSKYQNDVALNGAGGLDVASLYGLDTTGVADCTDAAQAAIDENPGRKFLWRKGQYRFDGTLHILARGTHWLGEVSNYSAGASTEGASLIHYGTGPLVEIDEADDDDPNDWAENNYDGVQDHRFADLRLAHGAGDTPLAAFPAVSYKAGSYGIRAWRAGKVVLNRVAIERFGYNYWSVQSDVDAWSDCSLLFGHVGAYIGPRSDQMTIDRLYVLNSDEAMIFDGCRDARIRDLQLVNCGHDSTYAISVRQGTTGIYFDKPWLETKHGATDLIGFIDVGLQAGYGAVTDSCRNVVVEDPILITAADGVDNHARALIGLGKGLNTRLIRPQFPVGLALTNFEALVLAPAGTAYTNAQASITVEGLSSLSNAWLNEGTGTPDVGVSCNQFQGFEFASLSGEIVARRIGASAGADQLAIGTGNASGRVRIRTPTKASGQTTRVQLDKTLHSGSAAPVAGTWEQGDIVLNTGAAASGFVGWVCTTAGTPGTWKTFGAISA